MFAHLGTDRACSVLPIGGDRFSFRWAAQSAGWLGIDPAPRVARYGRLRARSPRPLQLPRTRATWPWCSRCARRGPLVALIGACVLLGAHNALTPSTGKAQLASYQVGTPTQVVRPIQVKKRRQNRHRVSTSATTILIKTAMERTS